MHRACELQFARLARSKTIIRGEKLVLDPKFLQDSRKTLKLKLVMILASLATIFLFARLVSFAMKICLEDSHEASHAMKFLSARLARK